MALVIHNKLVKVGETRTLIALLILVCYFGVFLGEILQWRLREVFCSEPLPHRLGAIHLVCLNVVYY